MSDGLGGPIASISFPLLTSRISQMVVPNLTLTLGQSYTLTLAIESNYIVNASSPDSGYVSVSPDSSTTGSFTLTANRVTESPLYIEFDAFSTPIPDPPPAPDMTVRLAVSVTD